MIVQTDQKHRVTSSLILKRILFVPSRPVPFRSVQISAERRITRFAYMQPCDTLTLVSFPARAARLAHVTFGHFDGVDASNF
jgi:hypothetical protein